MAPNQQPAVSFDQIIQQGRDRKKAEQLASTIFGKGKKDGSPRPGSRSKSALSPSLASRITKPSLRSSSSSSINRANVTSAFNRATKAQSGVKHDLFASKNPSNGSQGKGFSIKGAAGPYVVVGSNFAPGTSSADIRSATEPIAGEMLSCVVITSNPTVIAEMVFAEKSAAEMIIATLNNQKADGRLLHLYLKVGPPTRMESPAPVVTLSPPVANARIPDDRSDLFSERSGGRAPRHVNESMAEPEYQDGRYGFDTKGGEDVNMDYQPETEDNRREPRDEGCTANARSDRSDRGSYRQDYARNHNPRPGGYNSRGSRSYSDRRPQYSERLYSDNMYSGGSRNGGYQR